MPYLPIDTNLLEVRYQWEPGSPNWYKYPYRCPIDGSILIGALPEVGFVERLKPFYDPNATIPLYLYESLYGQHPPKMEFKCDRMIGNYEKYEGSVVAIKYETELFRTAHYCFSLLAVQPDSAQIAFDKMMNWLAEQNYIKTGKLAVGNGRKIDVNHFREISRELHELKQKGLMESMGPETP